MITIAITYSRYYSLSSPAFRDRHAKTGVKSLSFAGKTKPAPEVVWSATPAEVRMCLFHEDAGLNSGSFSFWSLVTKSGCFWEGYTALVRRPTRGLSSNHGIDHRIQPQRVAFNYRDGLHCGRMRRGRVSRLVVSIGYLVMARRNVERLYESNHG